MKKFLYFIAKILPNISTVVPMDDGSLYITYNNGKNQIVMSACDYENAIWQKQKIDGLIDRVIGLC